MNDVKEIRAKERSKDVHPDLKMQEETRKENAGRQAPSVVGLGAPDAKEQVLPAASRKNTTLATLGVSRIDSLSILASRVVGRAIYLYILYH